MYEQIMSPFLRFKSSTTHLFIYTTHISCSMSIYLNTESDDVVDFKDFKNEEKPES